MKCACGNEKCTTEILFDGKRMLVQWVAKIDDHEVHMERLVYLDDESIDELITCLKQAKIEQE